MRAAQPAHSIQVAASQAGISNTNTTSFVSTRLPSSLCIIWGRPGKLIRYTLVLFPAPGEATPSNRAAYANGTP